MRRNLALVLALTLLFSVSMPSRPALAQPGAVQIGVLLAPGWNNFAYLGANRAVGSAMSAVAGRYESLWTWDTTAQKWMGYNPLAAQQADFQELQQNRAYWVRMSSAGEVVMTVPPAQPGLLLSSGWNNFVYNGNDAPVDTALAPAGGRYEAIWRWDAARQNWNGYTPESPVASDFNVMGAKRSYFVYLSSGPTVLLTPPVSLPPQNLAVAVTPVPPVIGSTSVPALSARPLTAVPSSGTASAGVPIAIGSSTPAPSATPMPTVVPAGGPHRYGCYNFTSYQPTIQEVARAQNRGGHGVLTTDSDLRAAQLETQPDGDGNPTAAYVPPTLLKAIAWIESGWRQAEFKVERGSSGPTIASVSCAYGVMQMLTGMDIEGQPTAKQRKIGTDYLANIAASVQLLGVKWNFAPELIPAVLPRNPRAVESWYYPTWAYHCFGSVCPKYDIHNNPEDPALRWPRPMYNSPDQVASTSKWDYSDYPYQELVWGVMNNPPVQNGVALWPALAAKLPQRGSVGYPEAKNFAAPAQTLDPTPAE